ncbi:hypothetical protein BKM15_25990 [Pseudomonas syringae pv. syringae]|nr:hypothetical protein BKM15_25990 [Pseudomonas syringae pv. syringae]
MANKTTKVIVKTNDGKELVTEVENYSAKDMAEQLNNQSNTIVAIGDVVVHRSFVQGVRPVEETK